MTINMTLKGFRLATGILLAALIFAAGNYYLDWGFFGGAGKPVMMGVVLLFIVLMTFIPPKVEREMDAERESQLERERKWERTRDASDDQAESERVRRAIGMPPNKSLERTRDR
jgi:uncharacterized membrane protein